MENESLNQVDKKEKLYLPTEKNFIKNLPKVLKSSKRCAKEEIERIKTEMHYAKQDYKKRIEWLKDRIENEKGKVLLEKEKLKNPTKAYQDYLKQTKEHMGNEYEFIIDERVWNEVKE